MSGAGKGGSPNLALTQKHPPHHSAGAIKSGRHADFTGPPPTSTIGLKLGIRVKTGQTPTLVITKRGTNKQLVLYPLPASDPVVADLTSGLGLAADEQWVAYTASWDTSFGLKFDSELTLDPFDSVISANGFQVVTVALCHDTQTFTNGVYSYAVSVLPGKDSTGFPLSMSGGAGKKPAAGKKKASKGKPKRKASRKKKR